MDKIVGIIGLGIMGGAIARNLVERGWRVIGFDVNPERNAELAQAKVLIASDIAQLIRDAPIVMTSLAMALGALPIAMSLGAAATSRIPLGIVIVGGIIFSLILTLFVIPAMYSFLSRRKPAKEIEEEAEMEEGQEASISKDAAAAHA